MHIYYQNSYVYIFLSLETKRSLEWKRESRESKNTRKKSERTHSFRSNRGLEWASVCAVGCGVTLCATENAVWNGKPSECFKNTIKTKTRVQRKNCVFPFKIHNSFIFLFRCDCCLAMAQANFPFLLIHFITGLFFFQNHFFLFDCVFCYDFESIFVTV